MAAPVQRPWWEPLVGAGSLGLGGLQAMGGVLLLLLALMGPPDGRTGVFALCGVAWILPGAALAASGMGTLLHRAWARGLAFTAVGLLLLGTIAVGMRHRDLPAAVADAGQWALEHPEAPESARRWIRDAERQTGTDFLAELRDPSRAGTYGATYTAYCACPVLPWYLLVLALALFTRTASPARTDAP